MDTSQEPQCKNDTSLRTRVNEWVTRQEPLIRRLLERRDLQAGDREDVAQNVFLRLLERPYLQTSIRDVSAYLARVVHNECIRFLVLKRQLRLRMRQESLEHCIRLFPVHTFGADWDREALRAKLSARERVVFDAWIEYGAIKTTSVRTNLDVRQVKRSLARIGRTVMARVRATPDE